MFNKFLNPKTNNLTIKDILHGTKAGKMQSVGYMQVIPLISELEDNRFISPAAAIVGTSNYGSMKFKNPSHGILIVPMHAGYVVKEAAQNHAMSHAAILKAQKEKTYDTAMCIQQSQGGYIKDGSHKLSILPYALREKAHELRDQKSYGKLWDEIGTFNHSLGMAKRGHLEDFLKKFKEQLDQFVAEFECVPQQVGAIVLIDGDVVGVERAPSYNYWTGVWPALIRECYGSVAIEYRYQMGENLKVPKGRIPIREDVNSIDELEAALRETMLKEDELAKTTVRELLKDDFSRKNEGLKVEGLNLESIEHRQFTGQMVHDHGRIVYASLFSKKNWRKNADWRHADSFSI